MLNLLPTEERKSAAKEYQRRLWSAALMMSLFVLIGTGFLLLPSLTKINFNIDQAKHNLDVLSKKPAVSDYQSLESAIINTKVQLDTLNKEMTEHTLVADEIVRALKNKPNGIKIEDISWINDGDNGKELMLNGTADSRNTLSRFSDVLKSDSSFAGVSLPISDLAKSSGAQFSITINFK